MVNAAAPWLAWISTLGHDVYSYPAWISAQQLTCTCKVDGPFDARRSVRCFDKDVPVSWRSAIQSQKNELDFCVCKAWLLEHMPAFDLHFLPNGVAVNATSMLDDVIAFALMADAAAAYSPTIPLAYKLAYVLPYAGYHESRQNWRPLFFAKFFNLVYNATTVDEALGRLLAPNVFLEWTAHYWPSSPRQPGSPAASYAIEWSSSTAPPVVSPLEFVAYGYGSCSAWATFVTYVLRAVGLPARQAGTPCWNSVYGGVDFRGLSQANPNVSLCWHGGSAATGHGGGFLNNHNWVEVYVPGAAGAAAEATGWTFVNVPPGSKEPGTGLCGTFDAARGCGFDATAPKGRECDHVSGGPGAAMRDHEIMAITWSLPEADDDAAHGRRLSPIDEGGPVLSVAGKSLTDGHTPLTPLVWAPQLTSPLGDKAMRDVGLRVVNRTEYYRCKPSR